MNELFLSGTILTLVKTPTTGDTSHVVCQLRHSHRNRQQQVIHETYTVHAWNRLADWAAQTLMRKDAATCACEREFALRASFKWTPILR